MAMEQPLQAHWQKKDGLTPTAFNLTNLVAQKKAWEERQATLDAKLKSAAADQPNKSAALKALAAKCYKVVSAP